MPAKPETRNVIQVLCALVLICPIQSFAWDCNSNCDACILRNIFTGGCSQMGHDATCEAVKAACQIPPLPGLPSPEATTNCLHNLLNCPKEIVNSIPAVQLVNACFADVPHCPENIIKTIPAQALQPIIDGYKTFLFSQAGDRWINLPDWFVAEFSADYPEIDLKRIRYVKNINTVHGANITLGNNIFLTGTDDPGGYQANALFLHELQHSAQWALKGGEQAFLSEYILHSAGQILTRQSINEHDNVSFERDAIAKSRDEISRYGHEFHIKNDCNHLVNYAIAWIDPNSASQRVAGFYSVSPGKESRPFVDSKPIHTVEDHYFIYASAPDTGSSAAS